MGEKLRSARKAAKMSQVHLAILVGCHQKDIARWEAGREPKALTLKKLAQALGCSMDDLV